MIRNLTPHPITLVSITGEHVTIPSSGRAEVASVAGEECDSVTTGLHSFRLHRPTLLGRVTGLPLEVSEGDVLVVSAIAGAAVRRELAEGVAGMTEADWHQRHAVLAACLCPGTGPEDFAIRELPTLPDGTRNPRAGQIVAVTRLVMP